MPLNSNGQSSGNADIAAAGISGGLGVISALLSGKASSQQQELNRKLAMAQLLSGVTGDQQKDLLTRQQSYMDTMQQDPVAQQRHLFSAGLLRDIAQRGPAWADTAGLHNTFQPSDDTNGFLSQDALAGNASRFYEAAGQLNPYAQHADLASMGFGAAGAAHQGGMDDSINSAKSRYEQLNGQRRQDLLNAIDQQQQTAQQPKKSSWLKKLLIGAGIGASAFIPGLPGIVAPMLLGSGIGMATGGVQGAITGAAGGAMSGGSGGTDYFNRRVGQDINV